MASTRTPAQDFVRALCLLDAKFPENLEDAVETLLEFALDPEQVVQEGHGAVARLAGARRFSKRRRRRTN